ncbi:MAG: hypothetical protein FJ386_05230 [Verrucomicrobia bacterium]|nr:hypothetical protein [Verrucomicrobiota bacterium]
MNNRATGFAALLAFSLGAATGAEPSPLVAQARASLEKATAYLRTISTEGGYLWRYSPDLTERAGEVKATATQVWIQPPGTPAVGAAFLEAFAATKDARHLDAARAAAVALATGQLESGGWDYLIEFDSEKSRAWFRRTDAGKLQPAEAAARKNISTYDDDNSQSAVRFLLDYCDVAKSSADPRDGGVRAALDYGLKKLMEAQYPNGAWPQRFDGKPRNAADYPILKATLPKEYPREYTRENYFRHYTLNDNTQRDCVRTALDAFHRTGRREFLEAAKRGGDFLILAQLPEPQPVWAQQYNARMEPAWARAFEPPAACGNESIGAMRTLVEIFLETGDAKYLAPIPAALEWFKRSEIAPNVWARYYELHTNKQLFGDRDGKIYYRIEDISAERRGGYSWRGEYGVNSFRNYFENVQRVGREEWNARRAPKPRTPRRAAEHAQSLEPRVKSILAAQDAQGRWITRRRGTRAEFTSTDLIETSAFIANMAVLSEFIEASQ